MYDKIDEMIASALKRKSNVELDVYRSIKTAFLNYKTAKAGNKITNEVEVNIINKLASQRKESIAQYTSANRLDLAAKEQSELDVLLTMLPKEPTEDEIIAEINSYVATLDHKITMADMKGVMQAVKTKYPTVNGGVISKHVKSLI